MICYKDMTFCRDYETCIDGSTCHRALTEEVKESARKWFGGDEAPVCRYMNKPSCYKEIK